MKIRTDFVTNSSSSSFIIAKDNLDMDQISAIRNHIELAEKMNFEYTTVENDYTEKWDIEENEDFITGYTWMDNFNMYGFLKEIDVPSSVISWGEFPFSLNKKKTNDCDETNCDDDDDDNGSTSWRDLLHLMED